MESAQRRGERQGPSQYSKLKCRKPCQTQKHHRPPSLNQQKKKKQPQTENKSNLLHKSAPPKTKKAPQPPQGLFYLGCGGLGMLFGIFYFRGGGGVSEVRAEDRIAITAKF